MGILKDLLNGDNPDWNKIHQLIQSNNELVRQPIDEYGYYTLHFLCTKEDVPYELFHDVITHYPQAVEIESSRDDGNMYPLHIACQHKV